MRVAGKMIEGHISRGICNQAMDDGPAKRALVVDDDRGLRELLALFLAGIGFEVAVAENGQAALELFRRRPFDLVLTDLQMPVMNGLKLMASIKSASQHTPVLLMTGLNTPDVARFARAAAAVLYKPFKFEELKSTVDKIFGYEERDAARCARTANS
ncbi:MAG: response regulator [Desulfobacterales bacterium]